MSDIEAECSTKALTEAFLPLGPPSMPTATVIIGNSIGLVSTTPLVPARHLISLVALVPLLLTTGSFHLRSTSEASWKCG